MTTSIVVMKGRVVAMKGTLEVQVVKQDDHESLWIPLMPGFTGLVLLGVGNRMTRHWFRCGFRFQCTEGLDLLIVPHDEALYIGLPMETNWNGEVVVGVHETQYGAITARADKAHEAIAAMAA